MKNVSNHTKSPLLNFLAFVFLSPAILAIARKQRTEKNLNFKNFVL